MIKIPKKYYNNSGAYRAGYFSFWKDDYENPYFIFTRAWFAWRAGYARGMEKFMATETRLNPITLKDYDQLIRGIKQ